MLMRESSDFDDSTSDDGELNEEDAPDVENHGKHIFFSKAVTDQRFIKIYQMKRKDEDRKRLKLQPKSPGKSSGKGIEIEGSGWLSDDAEIDDVIDPRFFKALRKI